MRRKTALQSAMVGGLVLAVAIVGGLIAWATHESEIGSESTEIARRPALTNAAYDDAQIRFCTLAEARAKAASAASAVESDPRAGPSCTVTFEMEQELHDAPRAPASSASRP